jgi:hypothetical protein
MSVSSSSGPWWWQVLSIGVVLAIAAVLALIKTIFSRLKQSRLRSVRSGSDIHSFQMAFEGESIPVPLLDFIYNYFREYAEVKDFPIMPNDVMRNVYSMDEQEFSSAFRELREQLKCRELNDVEWEKANDLKTVADMVRFIAMLNPKLESQTNLSSNS